MTSVRIHEWLPTVLFQVLYCCAALCEVNNRDKLEETGESLVYLTNQNNKVVMQLKEYFIARLPLFYVFLSGIGFSLQTLVIKLLAEGGFHGSFQVIFIRGFIQMAISGYFIYYNEDRRAGKGPSLCGDNDWVRFMLCMRAIVGFGGIAFSFMAVELISIGDSTVLCMLSPLIASILSYFLLGEPWRLPEFFATLISLVGATLVAKPPFIFGSNDSEGHSFYLGVTFALTASVSAAFAYICVRVLGTTAKMPWANVCFAQSVGQIALCLPGMYLSGQKLDLHLSGLQVLMIITAGFIGANSQISMTLGMQREKSAAATAMRMSDVAFGYIWQISFTQDHANGLSIIGALLITSSIMIIVLGKSASSAPSPAQQAVVDGGTVELTATHRSRTGGDDEISSSSHAFTGSSGYTEYDIAAGLQDDFDFEVGFREGGDDDTGDGSENDFSKPNGIDRRYTTAVAATTARISMNVSSFLARALPELTASPMHTCNTSTVNDTIDHRRDSGGDVQYSTLPQSE